MTLKQQMLVHCNKKASNGIKLCLSFSPGLKSQAVYFKNIPTYGGLRPQAACRGFAPGPHC